MFDRGRYEEAAAELQISLTLKRKTFQKHDTRIAETAMLLAISHHRLGRHKQARHFCEQATHVENAAKIAGYETPKLERALGVLKNIKATIKKQAKSETQLQKLRKQHETEL